MKLLKQPVKYANNHVHTEYSNLRLLDCINKVNKLVDYAIEIGYSSISITDHCSLSSHVQCMKKNKELKEKGIDFKINLGDEIYLVDDVTDTVENYQGGITKFYHFILVAKDIIGYEQLRRIDSLCWDNSFYTGKMRRTFIDRLQMEEIIGEDKGHLVATTACLGGQLANLFRQYENSEHNIIEKHKIHDFISWCKNMFPNDFAFEMQPSFDEEQVSYNKFLIKMSECYNIPLVIHTDAHYLKAEDKDVHMAFLTSREADRGEGKDFYATTYLMSVDTIWEYFKPYMSEDSFIQAIENSYNLTKDCELIDMEHGTIVPERDLSEINFSVKHIFKEWYDKCSAIKDFAYSDFEQDRYLLYMIEVGFLEKKQEFNEENVFRVNTELEEIWGVSENLQQRVSAYYNLVDYIVDICWEIGFVGISRGSVTGYYTMYLIDMQQMNPIKWNLPHWRHLTKERPEMPDVDLDTSAKNRAKIVRRLKEVFGSDNILNIATFRTETSKSAIKTSCRGLGISSDEGDYLASLVPSDRGKLWTIHDCFYGNEEKERKPVSELLNEIDRLEETYTVETENGVYKPHLKETIESIDGLVSGLSLHASGIYIFKDGYIKQNSKMKTPRGDDVTAWSMTDSDYCGGLKYDSLTTECQDKLEVCIDYLIKGGKIEWQGSYRDTYNKYLHPDVLDYDNQEMWDRCSNGQIIDLFQFITPVGGACIKKTQPHNLVEMMNANSLMRISVKDGIQPIDKFIRNKSNIQYWYDELDEYGITNENEIKALEDILLINYGVANTQEDIMELSMRPEISNFNLIEANKMRKIVAKKKDNEVAHLKEMFYSKGKEAGNSENVLNYVWEQCITPQLAYSFSRNHVNPYSAEALQEMNLYHFFPHCYWNCAALAVNAASVDVTNDYDGVEDDEEVATKSTDYGKVAKAIYRSKNFGVPVLPPDINKSQLTFTPIEEDNTIRFGLAGISGINQDIAKEIIDGRPYESFEHFYNYHKSLRVDNGEGGYRNSLVTKSKMINLIKSGCFDCFNPNRVSLMKWLCVYETGKKESLTTSNLPKCIEIGVDLPKNLVKAYNFKKYVCSKEFFYCNNANAKSKKDYILEPRFAKPYFEEHYIDKKNAKGVPYFVEEKDYYYDNGNMIIVDKSLEKGMSDELNQLKEYLNKQEIVDDFNKKNLMLEYCNMVDTNDVNKWAFDAVCFYDREHELANVDLDCYNIVRFSDLPEEPLFEETTGRGGRVFKRYVLSRICGTVLSRNDNNHLVDILTPDEEVVTLNIPQGQFGFYKKVVSENIDGKKVTLEDSWLKRGNKIIVCGYRRGDAFFVKRYAKSIYQHSIVLINKINEDGTLELILERYNPNDNLE